MNNTQDSAGTSRSEPGVRTPFIQRLFRWRVLRRWLFVAACLVTLIGLFYAVEDWRGKRAWEKCRRELEAKGEVLDWNAYIPAPVPDEQNFYKAPKMAEWFIRNYQAGSSSSEPSESRNTNAPFALAPRQDAKDGPVLVAEVKVVLSTGPLPSGKVDAVLRFDDPAAREQAAKFLRESIGPCAEGARTPNILVARPSDQIKAVHLVLHADTEPTPKALAEFFPHRPAPHKVFITSDLGFNYFQVVPAGSNSFLVSLKPPIYAPAEYLALSQPAVPDLDLLRQALERPFARMDGDYQQPYEHPVPNLVRLRTVAQMLSQRAQCYLLLGQPEAAWHELALLRDLCHMLEAKPASDCPTLVEAMIEVAIGGLYLSVIEDGFRLQAWREPQLVAMQTQLAQVNFPPLLYKSLKAERAATCRTFEISSSAELRKLFNYQKRSLWDRLNDLNWVLLALAPRGWMYQNMCYGSQLEQPLFDSFDLANHQVRPGNFANFNKETEALARKPYSFLVAMGLPNFVKAVQTTARNQTLANEAYIACGLERYRLAHRQYPETLEALVPQFAEKLPHDLIGGQPLKYHRTADGQFVLYSIGWNEQDDGGVPGKTIGEGDWVWQ